MNIEFSREQESLISQVAKSNNLSEHEYIVQKVLQAVDNEQHQYHIEQDIDLLVDGIKPNFKADIKKFFSDFIIPFISWYSTVPFLIFIVCVYLSSIAVDHIPITTTYSSLIFRSLLLVVNLISLASMIIGVRVSFFIHDSGSKKPCKSRFLRLHRRFNSLTIDNFATRIRFNYSLEDIKQAERHLEQSILYSEKREKQLSTGSFIISIVLLTWIEFNLGSMFKQINNIFLKYSGELSLVVFTIFLVQFIVTLGYFNYTIYDKQALIGLKQAQDS